MESVEEDAMDKYIKKKALQKYKSKDFAQGEFLSFQEKRSINTNSEQGDSHGVIPSQEGSEEHQKTDESLLSDQSPMRLRGSQSLIP